LIKELVHKNNNQKKAQNIILESMKQGVVLVGEEGCLFFNTKIKNMLIQAINGNSLHKLQLSKYMGEVGLTDFESIDPQHPDEKFVLDMKLFSLKANEKH
jgi:hypothetical protein